MRSRLVIYIAAGALVTGCTVDGRGHGEGDVPIPIPNVVACQDAPQLRLWAAEARSEGEKVSSDQVRITNFNRATFFGSMAIAAELQCLVTLSDADQAVEDPLEAARSAESARSFYERTVRWSEAHHGANRVIELLVQQVPGRTEITVR